MKQLTDLNIKNLKLKPGQKKLKISDGNGLDVLVMNKNRVYFIARYNYQKKANEIHLGTYPSMSLHQARIENDAIRTWLKLGIDPRKEREKEKQATAKKKMYTVEYLCMKTLETAKENQVVPRFNRPSTYEKDSKTLARHIFPKLGDRLLKDVTTPEWMNVLEGIETETGDMRLRVKGIISKVYKYAIQKGLVDNNPIKNLDGAFKRKPVRHQPALIDKRDVKEFLLQLEVFKDTSIQSYYAIWLHYYTWLRPTEHLSLRWEYWDRAEHMLIVPAENMKKGKNELVPHYVPLSHQAEQLLLEIEQFNQVTHKPDNGYIFASEFSKFGMLSDNAVNHMIKRCGFKGRQTRHGFRATARTLLGEEITNADEAMEKQLDHAERNKVKVAYFRTKFLPQRKKFMQDWADMLDTLKPQPGAK